MATENILMEAVKRGGDRQELHEVIREHSHAAADRMKAGAAENTLIHLLAEDGRIPLNREDIERMADPMDFVGRASGQVREFLLKEIDPILDSYAELLEGGSVDLKV